MTTPTKREYPALPNPGWAMSDAMIALLRAYADPLLDEIERLKEEAHTDGMLRVRYGREMAELRATIERQQTQWYELCRFLNPMVGTGKPKPLEWAIEIIKLRAIAADEAQDEITALQAELKEKKE